MDAEFNKFVNQTFIGKVNTKNLLKKMRNEGILVDYFFCGSRRFGFQTESSDWDISLLLKDKSIIDELSKYGFHSSLEEKMDYHSDVYRNDLESVHLIIYDTNLYESVLYEESKISHEKIQQLLEENPEIKEFILKTKKEKNIQGCLLYSFLNEIQRAYFKNPSLLPSMDTMSACFKYMEKK